jgi:hypothetical protein
VWEGNFPFLWTKCHHYDSEPKLKVALEIELIVLFNTILGLAKEVKEGKSHKKCAPKLPKASKYNVVKKLRRLVSRWK